MSSLTYSHMWLNSLNRYRGIVADVIVYIVAHLHMALRIEGNKLDIN